MLILSSAVYDVVGSSGPGSKTKRGATRAIRSSAVDRGQRHVQAHVVHLMANLRTMVPYLVGACWIRWLNGRIERCE